MAFEIFLGRDKKRDDTEFILSKDESASAIFINKFFFWETVHQFSQEIPFFDFQKTFRGFKGTLWLIPTFVVQFYFRHFINIWVNLTQSVLEAIKFIIRLGQSDPECQPRVNIE